MVVQVNRELTQQAAGQGTVIREPLRISAGRTSTVPRHTDINDSLAKKICKDFDTPQP